MMKRDWFIKKTIYSMACNKFILDTKDKNN